MTHAPLWKNSMSSPLRGIRNMSLRPLPFSNEENKGNCSSIRFFQEVPSMKLWRRQDLRWKNIRNTTYLNRLRKENGNFCWKLIKTAPASANSAKKVTSALAGGQRFFIY